MKNLGCGLRSVDPQAVNPMAEVTPSSVLEDGGSEGGSTGASQGPNARVGIGVSHGGESACVKGGIGELDRIVSLTLTVK